MILQILMLCGELLEASDMNKDDLSECIGSIR